MRDAEQPIKSTATALNKIACQRGGRQLKVWVRADMKSRTCRSTQTKGPSWDPVIARITVDADTLAVTDTREITYITPSLEHGKLN